MAKLVSALSIGLIFGLGIAISGMANPAKVLNFFDLAGTWDPSLIFVMGGALGVAAVGYGLLFRTARRPVFGSDFVVPKSQGLDWPLLAGSALFGVGWGIAGFCPGGAIPALGLGEPQALVFVGSMIAGIVAARTLRTRFATLKPA
jgi:uncharacterized protein